MPTVLTSECNSYIQSNAESGSDSSQRFYEKWLTFRLAFIIGNGNDIKDKQNGRKEYIKHKLYYIP